MLESESYAVGTRVLIVSQNLFHPPAICTQKHFHWEKFPALALNSSKVKTFPPSINQQFGSRAVHIMDSIMIVD